MERGLEEKQGHHRGFLKYKGTTWFLLSPELLPKPISKNTSNSTDSPLSGSEERGLGDCVRKATGAPRDATESESFKGPPLLYSYDLSHLLLFG